MLVAKASQHRSMIRRIGFGGLSTRPSFKFGYGIQYLMGIEMVPLACMNISNARRVQSELMHKEF
jgi:hypothetical protein